jgi:hypothetical protein
MGIEPHFNLCNYFFRVRLQPDSDAEAVVWGYADIYVRTRSGIDPYFRLPVSNPPVGWRKVWFFLRNDTGVPLPVVMGRCPAVQPSWRYGVAKNDTHKLQPMRDVLQSLLRDGLTGVDLLHTFVDRHVQPLRWREVTMWSYPGPSCPNHSFSAELVDEEVDTRVQRILVLRVNQHSSPVPLWDGVVSPLVSPLGLISA